MASSETSTIESSKRSSGLESEQREIGVQWVFPDTTGKRVTWLRGTPQVVGRDAGCDTVLLGDEVSRRHVELRRTGPVCVVRDLDSKNGLFHNGKQVSSAAFSPGDVLRVGEWIGVVIEAVPDEVTTVGEIASGLFGGVALRRLAAHARAAAKSPLTITLTGETGTGKERLAQAIHAWSERPGSLLAVNCAGYTEALAAAELFGHRKGAFTGADNHNLGHVRAADGGTLFLDEVAELPAAVQAQLLRVIEQGEVLPVGEAKALRVDVRFLCAAQVPLQTLVAEKRFRADLRARLEGVTLELPPLRSRRSDIPFLCETFLQQHAGARAPQLDHRVVELLCLRDWPLNVRELNLLVRRLLALFPGESTLKLTKVSALLETEAGNDEGTPGKTKRKRPVDDLQRGELEAALERCNGNLTKAATEVGITRAKAYRLLQQ
jgi:transcriptional regulator with GAF, ATPase, and Fis domain